MASTEALGFTAAPASPARRALAALLHTEAAAVPLLLRGTLGAVMFPHGAQKALGWFGGGGFQGTMSYFTESVGMPAVLGLLVIAAEFLGSLLLVAGLATRFAAASIGLVMIGAAVLVHAPNGFFMNWFGNQAGEGFEFHFLAIALATALVVQGGGRWSLDRKLWSA
jgi:putative oxidoreductase